MAAVPRSFGVTLAPFGPTLATKGGILCAWVLRRFGALTASCGREEPVGLCGLDMPPCAFYRQPPYSLAFWPPSRSQRWL